MRSGLLKTKVQQTTIVKSAIIENEVDSDIY